jgi:hypothetical protein
MAWLYTAPTTAAWNERCAPRPRLFWVDNLDSGPESLENHLCLGQGSHASVNASCGRRTLAMQASPAPIDSRTVCVTSSQLDSLDPPVLETKWMITQDKVSIIPTMDVHGVQATPMAPRTRIGHQRRCKRLVKRLAASPSTDDSNCTIMVSSTESNSSCFEGFYEGGVSYRFFKANRGTIEV